MYIKYYNDGKGKFQSHEMSLEDEENFYDRISSDIDIISHDIRDLTVYGETKEECYKKLQDGIDYLIKEMASLQNLLDLGVVTIKEVDCTGKVL